MDPGLSDYIILPYVAVADDAAAQLALDDIFFSSSNTKVFSSDGERVAFRERWLGRYLTRLPHQAFVAVDGTHRVVGYLVGSVADPVRDEMFADLEHFKAFAHLTPRYPAQLHVNLDAAWRGRGIGTALIDAFVAVAHEAGAPGVHVVTSRGARNVAFYSANGFVEVGASRPRPEVELVFLGRDLAG